MSPTLNPYKRAPRLTVKAKTWTVDDVVHVGSTRWAIRVLNGDHVELEAMNVSPGIWWTTTLTQLPDKVAEQ